MRIRCFSTGLQDFTPSDQKDVFIILRTYLFKRFDYFTVGLCSSINTDMENQHFNYFGTFFKI